MNPPAPVTSTRSSTKGMYTLRQTSYSHAAKRICQISHPSVIVESEPDHIDWAQVLVLVSPDERHILDVNACRLRRIPRVDDEPARLRQVRHRQHDIQRRGRCDHLRIDERAFVACQQADSGGAARCHYATL